MSSRDIVWITLESVRRDHTSLSNHERDTTPFLRELASERRGASFPNCHSHGLWTRPSSASILSGTPPSTHRVWSYDAALPGDVRSIPEQLSEVGYQTVAVSPNAQLSDATGLNAGFDTFHYLGRETLLREAGFTGMLRYAANLRRHSAGFTTDTAKHCLGYLNKTIATDHIERAAGDEDPLFLYLHLGDSHRPYYPPRGWRDRFADDLELPMKRALAVALEMSLDTHRLIAQGIPLDDQQWNAIEVLYDTAISYVDDIAAEVVATAREHLEDPLIVVTADHGEFLGEHGLLSHMLVPHTCVTNVPLVTYGLEAPASATDRLVQHADVLSMLSADCGLDLDVPVGQDIRHEPREFAVTQRGPDRAARKIEAFREYVPDFDASRFREGLVTSLRTEEFRYQRGDDGADLYRLPDETASVNDDYPDVCASMDEALETWLETFGHGASDRRTASFTDGMQRQLQDLGYL
ncbi:sulfatase [Halobaculum halobium]|uniref:Sulfatase n=1 Tax=Halobaculum halobium TaxID=3032281 RepID=A0ABD5TA85_9EURY|nr:sulfatase [Halobaculum sp. SYNS20]